MTYVIISDNECEKDERTKFVEVHLFHVTSITQLFATANLKKYISEV